MKQKKENPNQIKLDSLLERVSILEKQFGTIQDHFLPKPFPSRHFEPWDNKEKEFIKSAFIAFVRANARVHHRTPNALVAHIRNNLLDSDYNNI